MVIGRSVLAAAGSVLLIIACDSSTIAPICDEGKNCCADDSSSCDTEDNVTWGLSDVSILFPAEEVDVPDLLGAVNELDGEEVTLLDESLFDRLGQDVPFLTESPNRDQHYPNLRVVSFRLDPCMDGLDPHGSDCRRAIRLVLQPIWPPSPGLEPSIIYDASIHLFYELDDESWDEMIADYNAIREGNLGNESLSVHPVLADEGMTSVFAVELKRLIVHHARYSKLHRMTFMATGRSGNNWFWGGLDRTEENEWEIIAIPEVGDIDGFTQFGRDSAIAPIEIPGFPTSLLRNADLDELDDEAVEMGLRALYRFENPTLSNSDNLRCSSCHLAATTVPHVLARRQLEEMDVPERYVPVMDAGARPVIEDSGGKNMHGFSYFQNQPTISQRVVNESAEVVRFLAEPTGGAHNP